MVHIFSAISDAEALEIAGARFYTKSVSKGMF
jgi:hypothetical protein